MVRSPYLRHIGSRLNADKVRSEKLLCRVHRAVGSDRDAVLLREGFHRGQVSYHDTPGSGQRKYAEKDDWKQSVNIADSNVGSPLRANVRLDAVRKT